jgi:hypothetical protein
MGWRTLLPAGLRGLVRRALGPFPRHRRRLTRPHDDWSIGIIRGVAPLSLSAEGVANPVLTREDVTDRRAAFVADPFLLRRAGQWFLFFELYNRGTDRGEIAVATSQDALRWSYGGVVLAEPFHLSYPNVFEWEGEVYMVPESGQAGQVRLYQARRFPRRWKYLGPLLEGGVFVDPSLFRHAGRWWMLVESNPEPRRWDTLRLYGADDLRGPWSEHRCSPICRLANGARPAGRVVHIDGRPIRFAQVCEPDYGTAVRAFEIVELSNETYEEREVTPPGFLGPGAEAWRSTGMHHVDAVELEDGRWIAAVDGCGRRASGAAAAPTGRVARGEVDS